MVKRSEIICQRMALDSGRGVEWFVSLRLFSGPEEVIQTVGQHVRSQRVAVAQGYGIDGEINDLGLDVEE